MLTSNEEEMQTVKKTLSQALNKMKHLNDAKHILGIQINTDMHIGNASLNQTAYIEKMLKKYIMWQNVNPFPYLSIQIKN